MAKADDKAKKTKRPTAEKREIQNKKRRLLNKTRRSKIRTAVRSLDEAINEKEMTQEKLNQIYSLVDKAVKTGLIKQNKADRTKARLTARVAKASA